MNTSAGVTLERAAATSSKTAIPREFRGVQALRGFAAVAVVLYHTTQFWSGYVSPARPVHVWFNGEGGVDIFFIISGFVMSLSTRNKRRGPHPARDFLRRRIERIVPLYWLITLLVLAKLFVVERHAALQNNGPHAQLSWQWIASSFLFIPYTNSLGGLQPVLAVGWTLNYEMFFYLLFAAALVLRISEVRLLTPVMLLLVAVGGFVHLDSSLMAFTSARLLEFLLGIFIARAVERRLSIKEHLLLAMLILGCAGQVIPAPGQYITLWPAFLAVLVVPPVALLESRLAPRIPRLLLMIGDASYSIYLWHFFLFAFVFKLLQRTPLLRLGNTGWSAELTTVALVVPSVTFICCVLYRLVESPINHFFHTRRISEARDAAH